MENCTIYSHYLKFDEIVAAVKNMLPKAQVEITENGLNKSISANIKGGLFGKSKSLRINYRERANPSYQLDKVECDLTQNLAGMANFIQSLPAKNTELVSKFLHKVLAANCEMAFMVEPGFDDGFISLLKKLLVDLDAFIFAQPNNLIKGYWGKINYSINPFTDDVVSQNFIGQEVFLSSYYVDRGLAEFTDEIIKGKIVARQVLLKRMPTFFLSNEDPDWFLVKLENKHFGDEFVGNHVMIKFKEAHSSLNAKKFFLVNFLLIPKNLAKPKMLRKNFHSLGWVFLRTDQAISSTY